MWTAGVFFLGAPAPFYIGTSYGPYLLDLFLFLKYSFLADLSRKMVKIDPKTEHENDKKIEKKEIKSQTG